jgi:hypothetical protein
VPEIYKQCVLFYDVETGFLENNSGRKQPEKPDLRHIFKKTGIIQAVTDTRGKQLDKQQQRECRVLRNGAGKTETQMKIHRSETHNS